MKFFIILLMFGMVSSFGSFASQEAKEINVARPESEMMSDHSGGGANSKIHNSKNQNKKKRDHKRKLKHQAVHHSKHLQQNGLAVALCKAGFSKNPKTGQCEARGVPVTCAIGYSKDQDGACVANHFVQGCRDGEQRDANGNCFVYAIPDQPNQAPVPATPNISTPRASGQSAR